MKTGTIVKSVDAVILASSVKKIYAALKLSEAEKTKTNESKDSTIEDKSSLDSSCGTAKNQILTIIIYSIVYRNYSLATNLNSSIICKTIFLTSVLAKIYIHFFIKCHFYNNLENLKALSSRRHFVII